MPSGARFVKTLLSGILIIIATGYALFELRWVILGPQVEIFTPAPGILSPDSFVIISGAAKNVSALAMNGAPIFIDETGAFEEAYVLAGGYNMVEFEAKDRFGRTRSELLELVYQPR